jgi:Predicted integral membrane protein (DUF2269)
MDLESWLHFAHIGGAIVWVGGGLMLSIVGLRARASADLGFMRGFALLLSYVGLRLFAPTVLIVLGSGVWLVLMQSGDFTRLWIALGLIAIAAAFLVGVLYQGRQAIALERIARAEGADIESVKAALGHWIAGYYIVLAILVFAVWDMIFKPG